MHTTTQSAHLLQSVLAGEIPPEFYARFVALTAADAAKEEVELARYNIRLGWWSRRVLRKVNTPPSVAKLTKLVRAMQPAQRQEFAETILADFDALLNQATEAPATPALGVEAS